MHRVQELVNVSFPQQHPRVEGPHTRFLFSLEHRDSGAFLIKQETNDKATIQAGRVAGVREKDIYAVMLPGSEHVDRQKIIATADVVSVSGFLAITTLNWKNGASTLPREGALAFLLEEAPHKLSVSVPESSISLRNQVESSRSIRCCGGNDINPLLEFQQQDGKLTLRNQRGVLLFSRRFNGEEPPRAMCRAAVTIADNVARARLFLSQACDNPEEEFHHGVEIQLRLVQDNGPKRAIERTGEDSIPENSEVLITLDNHDQRASAFVSVFEVEENGQINAVSANPDGIDLQPQRGYTIYRSEISRDGLKVIWPDNIPKAQAVVETLVFVISSAPVNLQFLASPDLIERGDTAIQSSLGHRLYRLAQGTGRRFDREKRIEQVRYDIVQWPFFLEPAGRVGDTPLQDHPDCLGNLTNLAKALSCRYERTGWMAEPQGLEHAISGIQEAMQTTPNDHPDLARLLYNLGNLRYDKYHRTGKTENIEGAIKNIKRAVEITPEDHPDLPSGLSNLAVMLSDRYGGTGNIHDLEEAIQHAQRAAEITTPVHPNFAIYLSNLANRLSD
ncbi:hypothetical protein BDW75DRAFT_246245 [Aspergillus navahoensis]